MKTWAFDKVVGRREPRAPLWSELFSFHYHLPLARPPLLRPLFSPVWPLSLAGKNLKLTRNNRCPDLPPPPPPFPYNSRRLHRLGNNAQRARAHLHKFVHAGLIRACALVGTPVSPSNGPESTAAFISYWDPPAPPERIIRQLCRCYTARIGPWLPTVRGLRRRSLFYRFDAWLQPQDSG